MAELDYCVFDLLIERVEEGKFRARVLSSLAGQATREFSAPFSALELENFFLRIGQPRKVVRRVGSPEKKAVQGSFLSLATDTPVVRYLDLPYPVRALTVKPPIKVLVMMYSSEEYPPLDVENEWNKLHQALSELEQKGLVCLKGLAQPTLSAPLCIPFHLHDSSRIPR